MPWPAQELKLELPHALHRNLVQAGRPVSWATGPVPYLGCSLCQPAQSLGRNPHTLPKGREVPCFGILWNPCHRLAKNLQNQQAAMLSDRHPLRSCGRGATLPNVNIQGHLIYKTFAIIFLYLHRDSRVLYHFCLREKCVREIWSFHLKVIYISRR